MTKAELAEKVRDHVPCTKREAKEYMDVLFMVLYDALVHGETVMIHGFGTFSVTERKERLGVNPQTGEKMTIPAMRSVKFKASRALKGDIK